MGSWVQLVLQGQLRPQQVPLESLVPQGPRPLSPVLWVQLELRALRQLLQAQQEIQALLVPLPRLQVQLDLWEPLELHRLSLVLLDPLDCRDLMVIMVLQVLLDFLVRQESEEEQGL